MTLLQMGVIEALANANAPVSAHMLAKTTATDELLVGTPITISAVQPAELINPQSACCGPSLLSVS